ncbi:MAG TPA: helicase-related protein, partial [Longimicrobiales bacterium]|nr:helicase-related protein [Longimicrobiales bacterium]
MADFQLEAVIRARAILEQRGGVLVADVVGLGKTFIGLGVIELLPDSVLVVTPASLRTMWKRELRRLPGVAAEVLTHAAVGLGRGPKSCPSLVVVDEAHAFRNPRTRRYQNLALICEGAKVMLLTATPVNNSLNDLYALLSLFLRDTALRDLGIGSLKLSITNESPSMRDLELIHRAVIIRRRRSEVKDSAASAFRFPADVAITRIEHEPVVSMAKLREALAALTFPAYQRANGAKNELLRYALLKRAESSRHAILCTLQRQIRFYEQFIEALRRGITLDLRGYRSLYAHDDQAMQLCFDELAFPSRSRDSDSLLERCEEEKRRFVEWRDSLAHVDHKLSALVALLVARRGKKTIVFSEYRDTARYLWRALRSRFRCGLIDGEGAWLGENRSTRREVIERFAPIANHASVHRRETCDLLIATDVLAEGMNLQDADGVVSYDLPWNPVRLMQRAGRIDRIGSPHPTVNVYNFLPDREFDQLIGLVRTLERKLETVRTVVGLDRPVLADELFDIVGSSPIDPFGFREKFTAPPRMDAIPVGLMGKATVLVGASRGHEWACFGDVDGSLDELPAESADSLIARALDVISEPGDEGAAGLTRVRDVTDRVLADLRSRNDLALVDRRGITARVTRVLIGLLATQPLLTDPDVFARVDRIVERLNRGVSLAEELALREIAAAKAGEFSGLLEALETVLSHHKLLGNRQPEWT